MKAIFFFLGLLFSVFSTAQTKPSSLVVKMAYNVIGNDYDMIVTFDPSTASLRQRVLPGMAQPLFFTDSMVVKDNLAQGQFRLLGWKGRVKGYQSPDSVNLVFMSEKDGSVVGSLVGSAAMSLKRNYGALAKELIQTTRQYIYDTSLVHTPEWMSYEKEINFYCGFAQDDLEFFAMVNRNISKLPFTHFGMSKMSDKTWKDYFTNTYESETPAFLKEINATTALLTIQSFGGNGKSLEKFMQEVIAKNYTHLIIDLRQNLGGGAGAVLALTKYLSNRKQTAGALLTNKWFQQHSRLPVEADYKHFAVFTAGSTNDLIQLFATQAGIILQAVPAAKTFAGTLHILTSEKTASACEPFVYGMQYFKRATIVGAKTAGAMLSKIPFEMTDGFKAFLPVTDYYTIDGTRLDKKGVEPNVKVPADQALETSLKLLQ